MQRIAQRLWRCGYVSAKQPSIEALQHPLMSEACVCICLKSNLYKITSRCKFCGKVEETRISDGLSEKFALSQGTIGEELMNA